MKSDIVNFLRKNILNNFFPSINEGGSIIVDYYIRIILFLFPLFLEQDRVFIIFTIKTLLYFMLTLTSIVFYIIFLLQKRIVNRKCFRRMDFFLIITVFLLLMCVIVNRQRNVSVFVDSIYLLLFILTYFLLRVVKNGYAYYLRLPIYSAVFIYIGLLMHYFTGIKTFIGSEMTLLQPEAVTTYLLLICCIDTCLYCTERKRAWKNFYIIMACVGYLLLFLQGDMISICLMGLILLLIPLVYLPTAELLRKNLILCFLFFFIYSNIPLLQYANLITSEKQINIQYSLYINLFLSIIGILICRYWGKVPQNIHQDTIIMKKFHKWYKYALIAVGIFLSSCLLIGSRISDLPDKLGMKMLKEFVVSLMNSINNNKSFFQLLLEDYGVIACAVWIYLAVLIIKYLAKRWNNKDTEVKTLLIISILFLEENFFYYLQPISTPMYIIYLVLALFYNNSNYMKENGSDD